MSTPLGNVWRAVLAVTGLQLAVLGYLVWTRVSLIKTGREITVDVVPVDPRDIFRGDYVVLNYPFSTTGGTVAPSGTGTGTGTETEPGGSTPAEPADVTLPKGTYRNAPVYVTLAPGPGDGASWNRVKIDDSYPASTDPGQVVIKGRVDYFWPGANGGPPHGRIRYGIESYFVPEGTGVELEQQVRDKKIRAVLAIGSDGTAAIKALEVEGKRIHEQPAL